MKKQITITIAFLLIVLVSLSFVSAYRKLCLGRGESIPLPPNEPRFTCEGFMCSICTTDDYLPAAPYRCYKITNCETISGGSSDETPPNLSVNSPEESELYTSKSILLDLKVNEKSDVYYTDNINGRGRWIRVCQKCLSYSRKRNFNEGMNDLTFRAVDVIGNPAYQNLSFFIDSKKPQTHKTEPRSGYADGNFEVQYTEENLKKITLFYGNIEIGMRNKSLTNCSSGKRQWCSFDVDLTDYNEQKIEYYFTIEDVVGNIKDSQIRQNMDVDTISPVLNNPSSFWSYTLGERYVYFKLNITEKNLDKITYSYLDSRNKTREATLCSRLKNGVCEKKVSFGKGLHNIDVQIIDKAGNAIAKHIDFNVN